MRRLIKYIVIFVSALSLLFICSCEKRGDIVNMKVSPEDKNLLELITTTYDETELINISSFKGTVNELNKVYLIECLREVDNGYYRAVYSGEKCVVVITFNNSGEILYSEKHHLTNYSIDFDCLGQKHSLEEVQQIDPNGDYTFLYTGKNDLPKISYHYTKDAYLITIEYNYSNSITSIKKSLI